MKQAAKKTQKKADMPRSLQLKNSSQEASSQEDPKEGSQETSSQETSSLFARFLHAFWTLLHAFFGSRRANPLQETKRFVYSLSSSWDLFRKNITIMLWSCFDHAWSRLDHAWSRLIAPDHAWSRLITPDLALSLNASMPFKLMSERGGFKITFQKEWNNSYREKAVKKRWNSEITVKKRWNYR